MKVYGPFDCKDGRKRVTIQYEDGRKRTIQYAKYVLEKHLGRELDSNKETVDHIDGDHTNDALDNLRILPREKHCANDAIRVKLVEVTCIRCGTKAYKRARNVSNNAKQGKSGPFCGKSCAGKYSAEVQNGRAEKLPAQPQVAVSERQYFRLKDSGV